MRTPLLLVGFFVLLSGCDTTGIDDDDVCQFNCGGEGVNATLDVSPRQTYLRTSDDDAVDSPAVSLADLRYQPGDRICFRVEGDFSLVEDYWASERGDGYLTAVFSSSDTLRDSDRLDRVPGAIDAGDDVFTLDTERNGLDTDIREDFRADDVCLTVPDDAEYVFFAAFDSLYGDNDNIDGTPFRVEIDS